MLLTLPFLFRHHYSFRISLVVVLTICNSQLLINSVVFFTSRKWGYIGNKTDDSFRLKFHPNTVRKSFRQGEIVLFHLTHPQTNPLNITTSHPPSISLITGEVEIEFLASYEQMGIMEVTKLPPHPLHSHHTSLTTLIPLPVLAQVNITLSQGIPTGGKPHNQISILLASKKIDCLWTQKYSVMTSASVEFDYLTIEKHLRRDSFVFVTITIVPSDPPREINKIKLLYITIV